MEIKQTILEALKNYYTLFYRNNAALHPKKIKEIKYFLDWLSDGASEANISYEQKNIYQKECCITMNINYFYSAGGLHFDRQDSATVLLVNEELLAGTYNNVFYSTGASIDVIPKEIKNIAKEVAQNILYNVDRDCIFNKVDILDCSVTQPKESMYYICSMNYPYPEKKNSSWRSFVFLVWDNEVVKISGPKKKFAGFF